MHLSYKWGMAGPKNMDPRSVLNGVSLGDQGFGSLRAIIEALSQ